MLLSPSLKSLRLLSCAKTNYCANRIKTDTAGVVCRRESFLQFPGPVDSPFILHLFFLGLLLLLVFLLHSLLFLSISLKVKVKVAQSCPTFCNPMDCTVYGILQARILEWVAFPFSRGSCWPRNPTRVSCIAGGFFTNWGMREVHLLITT